MILPFEKQEIDPEIKADDIVNRRVSDATSLLQRKVGKSAQRLQVGWNLINPNEVKLTLRDSTGEVSDDFKVDELAYDFRLKRRLSKLWSRLLDIRLDVQLDRIMHPEDEVAVP